MTITLNHTIVPARDKVKAATFFARLFGLRRGKTDYFATVKVNKTLTLLFDDTASSRVTTTPSMSATRNSTPSSAASRRPGWSTAARPGAPRTASSTTGAAAAASISRFRTAICSN